MGNLLCVVIWWSLHKNIKEWFLLMRALSLPLESKFSFFPVCGLYLSLWRAVTGHKLIFSPSALWYTWRGHLNNKYTKIYSSVRRCKVSGSKLTATLPQSERSHCTVFWGEKSIKSFINLLHISPGLWGPLEIHTILCTLQRPFSAVDIIPRVWLCWSWCWHCLLLSLKASVAKRWQR